MRYVAFFLVAACTQEGTLTLALVFPAGETRLPAATTRVRLTVEVPDAPIVNEAPVALDGSFTLVVSFDATDSSAPVVFEGLDAGGAVVARGLAPPVPLAAFTQTVTLFVGPPGRFATAPVALPGPRDEMAVAPLTYGLILAGGRDATGGRAVDMLVYSGLSHQLFRGEDLPAPRARLLAAGTAFNLVYLFGGDGDGDQPAADLWRFDTNVAPAGDYIVLPAPPTLARAGAAVVPVASDQFLLTGSPPALLDTTAGQITAIDSAPPEVGTALTAATTRTSAQQVVVVLGGPEGVFLYDGTFRKMSDAAVVDATAVRLPSSSDVLLIGPAVRRVTPTGTVTDVSLLAQPRRRPAAAVVRGTLVVAGGFDENDVPIGDAEVFDAATLAPRDVVPLPTARGGAIAFPLPNGQVVLCSGRGPGGPLSTIEIFTP